MGQRSTLPSDTKGSGKQPAAGIEVGVGVVVLADYDVFLVQQTGGNSDVRRRSRRSKLLLRSSAVT